MRTFTVHLPLAMLSGFVVFAVLNLAAWYNLRGEETVCRRQWRARIDLRIISEGLHEFEKANGEFPMSLTDILPVGYLGPDRPPNDVWGSVFQYRVSDGEFTLFSLGRDGKPGGIGLDADIFHDDRNQAQTLPTLRQFFLTGDSAEVDSSGFIIVGIVTGGIVTFTVFQSLREQDRKEKPISFVQLVVSSLFVIVLACLVGGVLLVFHVPSGH